MIGPKGRFTLTPGDERTHLFVSSGTGSAPFLAMMRVSLFGRVPRPTVFVNGVSYAADLGYRTVLEGWQSSATYPAVSRPTHPANEGWTGCVGRAESVLGSVCDEHAIEPGSAVAYMCGNPDTVAAAQAVLQERGFPDSDIRTELYWPKGRPGPEVEVAV